MKVNAKYIIVMSLIVLAIVATVIAVITNPSSSKFRQYILRTREAYTISEGAAESPMLTLFYTEKSQYCVFSIYTATFPSSSYKKGATTSMNTQIKFIGVFGGFIRIN